MSKENDFKVGDRVKIFKGTQGDDFAYGFNIGDEFVISWFNKASEALNHDGNGCKTECLELTKNNSKKWLWDGKEELKVGMWVFSVTHEEECEIEMITAKEFAFIDSYGEITSDRINCASTVADDREKLVNEFYIYIRTIELGENPLKNTLFKFYDEARKHK